MVRHVLRKKKKFSSKVSSNLQEKEEPTEDSRGRDFQQEHRN